MEEGSYEHRRTHFSRRPVRCALKPRTLLTLLLAAAALCGCARHYDIMLTNFQTVTNVRIPDLDKHLPYYTCVTATGRTFTVSANRISYICPHGETNSMFKNR